MTLVVCWEEANKLYAAADSLVSSNGSYLMDGVPKIAVVPVECVWHDTGQGAPRRSKFASFSFGLGFAGNTLVGQSVLLTVAQLLHTLSAIDWVHPSAKGKPQLLLPRLDQIAEVARKVAEIQIQRRLAVAEFVVFGSCPVTQRLERFELRPSGTPITMVLAKAGGPVMLGDKNAQQLWSAKFKTLASQPLAPAHALLEVCRDSSCASVGPPMQLVEAEGPVVRPMQLWRGAAPRKPGSSLRMLGLDLQQDIGPVGKLIPGSVGWFMSDE